MASNCHTNYNDHNMAVLDRCEAGDLLKFPRGLYSHWGVYVGNGQVIHMAGVDDTGDERGSHSGSFSISGKQFNKAAIKCDDFLEIVRGCSVEINNSKDRKRCPARKRDIVKRAFSKLGEIEYNVLWNNCEHFASWCRYGIEESDQVDNAMLIGAGIVAVAAAVVGTAAVISSNRNKEKKK
ncbi:phospholipase A and acyltransferase 2-like [Glandiceps talaboti]